MPQINQYTNTATAVTDADWFDLDKSTGGGAFQSQKLSLPVLSDSLAAINPSWNRNIYDVDGTLAGNRLVNFNSLVMGWVNVKQFNAEATTLPPLGTASFDFKGFGATATDELLRVGNQTSYFTKFLGDGSIENLVGNLKFGHLDFLNSANVFLDKGDIGIFFRTDSTFGIQSVAGVPRLNFDFATIPGINSVSGSPILFEPVIKFLEGMVLASGKYVQWDGGSEIVENSSTGDLMIKNTVAGVYSQTKNGYHFTHNTTSFVKETSAGFQFDSHTGGALIPRMTTAQKNAIASPATGLQVYDTNLNEPQFYNGTAWQNVGKRTKEVKYFTSGNVTQNTVIVGNFVELLSQGYKLTKVTVLFGEQSMNTNKTIPIEIGTLDTDSAAPTYTLQYTANVNAVVGAIQNKVYTFTPSVTLPVNKLLTVNTGAFTASTQILNNCLVTLTLEEI